MMKAVDFMMKAVDFTIILSSPETMIDSDSGVGATIGVRTYVYDDSINKGRKLDSTE